MWLRLSWESVCLACTKTWVSCPAPHKTWCALHTSNRPTWEMDEEQVVQDLSLVRKSLRLALDAWNPIPSKTKLSTECVQ